MLLPPEAAYAEAIMHGREKKSVTVYPWKLVYEMGTEERMLFNLEIDPAETANLIDEQTGDHAAHLENLENLLFHTLFGISDTWYVEIAAGEDQHIFDITVNARKDLMPGNINVHRLLGAGDEIIRTPEASRIEEAGSRLVLEELRFKGTVTLAFKADPVQIPPEFDFRIDGEPALDRTYLGETLEKADAMPFTQKGRRAKVRSLAGPADRPEPPYFLVWYEESRYSGDTAIKLDEETKKELRALGYIQ
jgi:hypothetical protein